MKKLLKVKKLRTIAALAVAIALLAAGTYAWFQGTATTEATTNMGRLLMNFSQTVGDGYYYEPGETVDITYTFDNIHANQAEYKPLMVKADFIGGTVEIRSNDEGVPLDPADYHSEDIDPNVVTLDAGVVSTFNADYSAAALWFVDRETGIYYGLIDPSMTTDAEIAIEFIGPNMGNVYQGAVFTLADAFPYTQVMEGAMLDLFGLNVFDLDPIDDEGNILGASAGLQPFVVSERDLYMNYLYAALGL